MEAEHCPPSLGDGLLEHRVPTRTDNSVVPVGQSTGHSHCQLLPGSLLLWGKFLAEMGC